MRTSATGYSTKARYPWWARFRVWCLLLVAVLGLLVSLFLGRFFEIRRLHNELITLREQERVALVAREELWARLSLKDDPEAIEQKARESLGLVKPNEQKVIFIEGD